jgi:hypothetical protein
MFLKIHIFASLRAIYTKFHNFTFINMTHLTVNSFSQIKQSFQNVTPACQGPSRTSRLRHGRVRMEISLFHLEFII